MRRAAVIFPLAAALISACTASTTETSSTTPTTVAGDLVHQQRFAARAITDILDKVGVEVAQVREVDVYPQYLTTEVQDPATPEHLDEYEWRDGSIEPPEPVMLSGPQEDVEAALFPTTSVDWRRLSEFVQEAEAASEANRPLRIEQARAQYVIVRRSSSFDLDGRVTLAIYISGPRRSGYVEMTSSGEILSVNVS
jgi:hypothetical protein